VTEEHPRYHRHATGGEFLTTLGKGLRGQRATQGALGTGMTSLPVGISAYDRLSRLGVQSEPQVHRWHHLGDDDA
jgi:hypothetical protein